MDDLISSVYRSATLQFPSCYFSFDVIQWSWQKAKAGSVGRHLNWWVTRTVLNFNVTNKGGEERKKKKKTLKEALKSMLSTGLEKVIQRNLSFSLLGNSTWTRGWRRRKDKLLNAGNLYKIFNCKDEKRLRGCLSLRSLYSCGRAGLLFNSSKDHDNWDRNNVYLKR